MVKRKKKLDWFFIIAVGALSFFWYQIIGVINLAFLGEEKAMVAIFLAVVSYWLFGDKMEKFLR